MNPHIMIVEDDRDLVQFLSEFLTENGYHVTSAEDGMTALKQVEQNNPDLVLLDLGLPNVKGETVCSEIKKINPSLPVIILTGRGTTSTLVNTFNIGADDYIAKPFEGDELLARIKARLRPIASLDKILKAGDLVLNSETLEVSRGGKKIELTPQEFKLLQYFLTNKGRVLSRDMILSRIWSASPDIETRVVDVYVGYLRKKIDSGFKEKLIESKRGFGYMIKN